MTSVEKRISDMALTLRRHAEKIFADPYQRLRICSKTALGSGEVLYNVIDHESNFSVVQDIAHGKTLDNLVEDVKNLAPELSNASARHIARALKLKEHEDYQKRTAGRIYKGMANQ